MRSKLYNHPHFTDAEKAARKLRKLRVTRLVSGGASRALPPLSATGAHFSVDGKRKSPQGETRICKLPIKGDMQWRGERKI